MAKKKNRIKTSIQFDKVLWKKIKVHCIKNEIDMSDYIETLAEEKLKNK